MFFMGIKLENLPKVICPIRVIGGQNIKPAKPSQA